MKFWVLSDIDSAKFSSLKSIISKFALDYPKIKVELSVKTRETMWESLFLHLRNRENPIADLIEIPHSWTDILAKLGMFLEMGEVVEGANLSKYPEFLRKGCGIQKAGVFFSLPWWMELYTLQYRLDMVKDISPNIASELKSWRGFLNVCEKIKKANKKKDFFVLENANPSGAISLYDVMGCVWNRGGSLFMEDFNRAAVSKREFVKGVEDFLKLAIDGYLPLFKENYYESEGLLSEGLRAMVFTGRYYSSERLIQPLSEQGAPDEKKPVLEAALYPNIARDGHFVSSTNLAVADSARDIDEVKLFMKALLAPRNLKTFTESFSVFPCMKTSVEGMIRSNKNYAVYRKILSHAKMTPNISVFPTYEFLMNRVLWNMSVKIAKNNYNSQELVKKLIFIQSEVDYLMSLY
ncbi:MAG: extracellular solute-binding protein [Elusimicrobiales bacterium]|nr:extracellular solute-binding protein [Elusimicrobiales bacterium]